MASWTNEPCTPPCQRLIPNTCLRYGSGNPITADNLPRDCHSLWDNPLVRIQIIHSFRTHPNNNNNSNNKAMPCCTNRKEGERTRRQGCFFPSAGCILRRVLFVRHNITRQIPIIGVENNRKSRISFAAGGNNRDDVVFGGRSRDNSNSSSRTYRKGRKQYNSAAKGQALLLVFFFFLEFVSRDLIRLGSQNP